MTHYRSLVNVPGDMPTEKVESLIDAYKSVIEQNGGKVEKTEMWGVKSLAYRIRKNRKAHFALLNIDAPPAALAEMERQMRISEDVLRVMTVRVEELESEPSAMMQKRDRDERKDRERGRRRDAPLDATVTGHPVRAESQPAPEPAMHREPHEIYDAETELDAYSEAILDELRAINDRLEHQS